MRTARLVLVVVVTTTLILTAALALPGLAAAETPPFLWIKAYAPTAGHDVWTCSATGIDGSLCLAGTRNAYATDSDLVVARYRVNGERRWVRRLVLSNHQEATATVVDLRGNVYVLASSVSAKTGGNMLLLKYSPTGALLWRVAYSSSGRHDDAGVALCVDGAGAPSVAGYVWAGARGYDIFVRKYRGNGTRLWSYFWDDGANGLDWATGLALDGEGHTYVAGLARGASRTGVVMRLAADGKLDWQDVPPLSPSAAGEECRDIAVRDGVVAVSAIAAEAYGDDVWLATYSTDGVRGWNTVWNRDEFDAPTDLAIDSDGTVVVCGTEGNGFGDLIPDSRAFVATWTSAGSFAWSDEVWSEGDNGDGWFTELALGADDGVYCLGAMTVAGDTDSLMVHYSAAGDLLRSTTIDRTPAGGIDRFECGTIGTTRTGTTVLYGAGWTEGAKGNANAFAVSLTP